MEILEMNTEVSKTKSTLFKLKKLEPIKSSSIYNMFINWVIGEFDLYLMHEYKKLKVYFLNGHFYMEKFVDDKSHLNIRILVEGKSKKACQKIMMQLENLYQHVVSFNEKNNTCY
jgi:hypothetical protein